MKEKTRQILVTDDDTRLRNLLNKYLSDNGFNVSVAKDANEARSLLQQQIFDLLILDVMLPKENGIEFAKSIRKNSKIPILMLTARGDPADRIDGLEAGADDYIPKPFEPKELLLRINNILKHTNDTTKNICSFGSFTFSFSSSRLKKDNKHIHITESETKIITILCQNLAQIVSREQLAKTCGDVDTRSIDVQITRLRRKIEQNPKQPVFLQTVRNQGYILYN